jgi:hypothetical protein
MNQQLINTTASRTHNMQFTQLKSVAGATQAATVQTAFTLVSSMSRPEKCP